jgi:hypothetical protein
LDTSKQNAISRRQLWLLFAVSVFATHVWGIINILREYPAWVLRMDLWGLLGTISVSLFFSLLDAVLPFAGVLLLAFIVPRRFFRDRLVAGGSLLILTISLWVALFHLNPQWFNQRQMVPLAIWAVTFPIVLGLGYWYVYLREGGEQALLSVVERLSTLAGLYLFLDFIGVIIIVIRNI